jgi:hypothetical protein
MAPTGTRLGVTTLVTALAVSAAAGQVGCGNGDVELGEAVNSRIEGLPVPEGAKRHPGAKGVWRVNQASYQELVTWYRERLPVRMGWVPEGGGTVWQWCGLTKGDGFTQWSYARDGRGLLIVQVSDFDPPTVQLGVDEEKTCSKGTIV